MSIEEFTMGFPHESIIDMLLLRDESGKTAATVTIKTKGSVVAFSRLYVRRDCRRKGYASRLVKHVIAAADRRFESVSCLVHAKNEEALQFYRALGFFASHHVDDEITMTFKLGPITPKT